MRAKKKKKNRKIGVTVGKKIIKPQLYGGGAFNFKSKLSFISNVPGKIGQNGGKKVSSGLIYLFLASI